MPVAGTALIVLGLFLVAVGIVGVILEETLGPGPVYLFGPSEPSWGRSTGAMAIGLGLSAGWAGWCLWFPGGRSVRKHHEKSHRNP